MRKIITFRYKHMTCSSTAAWQLKLVLKFNMRFKGAVYDFNLVHFLVNSASILSWSASSPFCTT